MSVFVRSVAITALTLMPFAINAEEPTKDQVFLPLASALVAIESADKCGFNDNRLFSTALTVKFFDEYREVFGRTSDILKLAQSAHDVFAAHILEVGLDAACAEVAENLSDMIGEARTMLMFPEGFERSSVEQLE